jgi:trans-aconitate methyltransferase
MTWKFDKQVAGIYHHHVRQHIPNYDAVINQSIDCCIDFCNSNDSIVDFGCATGYTLQRLTDAGFTNLLGVDSSQDMINVCDTNIAKYSTKLPAQKFKTIIANWVLHFNENKTDIINQMGTSIDNGFVFISDKMITTDYVSKKYHQWKYSQGVSWEDIKRKEQALQGVMFIHPVEWYIETLKQAGFYQIEVIDAKLGFVSLLAFKNKCISLTKIDRHITQSIL